MIARSGAGRVPAVPIEDGREHVPIGPVIVDHQHGIARALVT